MATISDIGGRKRSSHAKLKASSQSERLHFGRNTLEWKEHFANLLVKAPVTNDQPVHQITDTELPVKKGIFSEGKLEAVLNKLKNKNAPGLHKVPPENMENMEFQRYPT